jgi:hypothetical protein
LAESDIEKIGKIERGYNMGMEFSFADISE